MLLIAFALIPVWAAGYDASSAQGDLQQARAVTQHVPWMELLGPLAPIALSPFFGMACLSALSMLISRGVLPDNAFLRGNPILDNPLVFYAFLALALLTSLPRLTKVSKPLAQACDFLETYAGVVAVIVVQWAARHVTSDAPPAVVMAGVGAVSYDVLIAAASVVNIIVIQTVRFVFEMLVWISPVPLLDALFEATNKLVCAGLMVIYAFSPWTAFLANALIFLVCLALFRWARRKAREFRAMLVNAGRRIAQWLRGTGVASDPRLQR